MAQFSFEDWGRRSCCAYQSIEELFILFRNAFDKITEYRERGYYYQLFAVGAIMSFINTSNQNPFNPNISTWFLEANEIIQAFKYLGIRICKPDDINAFIAFFDTNNDGKISMTEFYIMRDLTCT